MQIPLQIVLDPQVPSDARQQIENAAEIIEHFHDRITSCRVAVTAPDHRHREGGLYEVHIVLRIPGHAEIIVSRKTQERHEHQHLNVAIKDAFHEARRQLQDTAHKLRADVKTHLPPEHGRIAKLFPQEGYGFIESSDGQEIYFHRNSIVEGSFEQLALGQEVRFVSEEGDKGTQASTVAVIGKHHIV